MLYEVVVRQRYFGKNPINVFHFSSTGTPASVSGAFALMSAMGFVDDGGVFDPDTLFDKWRNLVSNQVHFAEVQVAAMYDVEDFYVRPFLTDVTGARVEQAMTPVNAYGLHSSRVRTDIQSGSKRFVGCTEGQVDAGGQLSSDALSFGAQMAEVLTAPFEYDDEGNVITFRSCILKFAPYTTPKGNTAYKKQIDLATQLDNAAIGVVWSVMPFVRSQVSRQYN